MRSEWNWSLKQLGEDVLKTLEADRDFTIAVSGFPGSGKSVLAWHIAKNVDPNFDMKKQMIFTRQDLIDAANTLPPRSAIIVDEAVALLFRRDFMNTKQKEILKIMDMIRYKQYCIIFCVPSFWSLDSHLLQRVRLRLHIDRRAFALIFARSNSPFIQDCWYRKENEKLTMHWDQNPNAGKTKGFLGGLAFGDMPDYAKKEYLPLKDEKKVLREKEEQVVKSVARRESVIKEQRDKLIRILKEELKWSDKKIVEVSGIRQPRVSEALRNKVESMPEVIRLTE